MKEYETADFFKKEKYKLMIAIKIGRLLFCLLLKCLQKSSLLCTFELGN